MGLLRQSRQRRLIFRHQTMQDLRRSPIILYLSSQLPEKRPIKRAKFHDESVSDKNDAPKESVYTLYIIYI